MRHQDSSGDDDGETKWEQIGHLESLAAKTSSV